MYLHKFAENLPGKPRFDVRTYQDFNPMSHRTKVRRLYQPNRGMKTLHHRFLHYLRIRNRKSQYSFGVRKGTSRVQAINPHRGNRYVYVLDIADAFPSTDLRELADVLCYQDHRLSFDDVYNFLMTYCRATVEGGLATGAPASNHLFDLFMRYRVDNNLEVLLQQYGLTYTRYVDDLVFSSHEPIGRRKRKKLLEVVRDSGLRESPKKCGLFDLQLGPAVIFGITLSADGSIRTPGHYRRHLTGLIEARSRGADVSMQTISGKMGAFLEVLRTSEASAAEKKLVSRYRALQQRDRKERGVETNNPLSD